MGAIFKNGNVQMLQRTGRRKDLRFVTTMIILIVVLWLATRPYLGIFHDSRFYTVQALHVLYPERFAQDLYFYFGSQDQFTIFSKVYAPLLARMGMATTQMVCTVAGEILWVFGLVYLVRRLESHRSCACLSIAAVIALPAIYTSLSYGESFVTPRLLVEALTMIAMGLLVSSSAGMALLILGVAAAIHPLMAIPSFAVLFVYLALLRPRWWFAIFCGAALVLSLSAIGLQPFANIRTKFDQEWFDIVKIRTSFCLLTKWPLDADFRVICSIALGSLALLSAERVDRRFLGAALIVGIGGLVCTFLGGDLARNVFVIEIQPWRSMWLLALVANLYAVPTLVRLYRLGDTFDLTRLAFLTALGLLLISRIIPAVIVAAAPMTLVAALLAAWQFATGRRLPTPARLLIIVIIACVLVVAVLLSYEYALLMQSWPREFWRGVFSFALVIAALVIMVGLVTQTGSRQLKIARLLPWAAAVLVPLAVIGWDARTPWAKFVESSEPVPTRLADLLPQRASVYWEGGLELLWLRLRRPSYFACDQGTGAVFFRGTAMEFQRREEALWPLRTVDFGRSPLCPPLDKTKKSERTRADLRQVCDHEPNLDYLVLMRPVEDVEAKIWDSPVPNRVVYVSDGKLIVDDVSRFYIYACADVRSRDAGSHRIGAGASRS